MRCRKSQKWLLKDPEALSHIERDLLTEHIKTCDKCRATSRHLCRLADELQDAEAILIPPRVAEHLWLTVRRQIEDGREMIERKAQSRRMQSRRILSWAIPSFSAVCILFVLLMTKPWSVSPSGENPNSASVDVAVESAEIDGQSAQISIFEMHDPDMIFIWLDKNETLNGG